MRQIAESERERCDRRAGQGSVTNLHDTPNCRASSRAFRVSLRARSLRASGIGDTTRVAGGPRRRGHSMSSVTRRGFMAFTGLAAAVLSRAAAAQQTQATSGQDRAAADGRPRSRARDLTDDELEASLQPLLERRAVGRG